MPSPYVLTAIVKRISAERAAALANSDHSDHSDHRLMLFGFQYVDPLTGDFPSETGHQSYFIPQRMRWLLRHRSRDELDHLIFLINRLLSDPKPMENAWDRFAELADRDALTEEERHEQDSLDDRLISEVQQLFALSDDLAIEGAAWSELFAVFALALLNQAAEVEHYYSGWADTDSPTHEWRVLFNVTTWTARAQEAAAFAQASARAEAQSARNSPTQESEDQVFQRGLSRKNQRAAYQRHAPTQQAILALTEFHLRGAYPSFAAAVHAFCEAYPEKVRHLAPTNRQRTLAEGLGRQIRHLAASR